MTQSHATTISVARLAAFGGLARLFQSVDSINRTFAFSRTSSRQTASQARATVTEEPLLRFGPGGSFVTDYHPFRGGLMVVAGQAPAGQKSLVREVSDWMERLLGIRRWRWQERGATSASHINHTVQEPVPEIAPATSPSINFNSPNFTSSGNAGPSPWRHGRWSAQLSLSNTLARTLQHVNEPHTTTNSHIPLCARLPQQQGLFPDDAGDRKRTRRQQSHGLRARRGADREGCAGAQAQQGSLFGDCD